jgi:hypothetical protein
VGEEAQVDRGVEQVRRLGLAALYVDHIGDRLEAEEADADRQRDRHQRQRHPKSDGVEDVGDVGDEEAVVLEDGQDAEVEDHAGGREQLAEPLVLRAVDGHDR